MGAWSPRDPWRPDGSLPRFPHATPQQRKAEIADGLRDAILRMEPGDTLTIEARDGSGTEPLYVITTSTTRDDALG